MHTFDDQIRECYRRADDCTRGAESAGDYAEKAKFHDMRSRWLLLAHSYEFLERLARITDTSAPPT